MKNQWWFEYIFEKENGEKEEKINMCLLFMRIDLNLIHWAQVICEERKLIKIWYVIAMDSYR